MFNGPGVAAPAILTWNVIVPDCPGAIAAIPALTVLVPPTYSNVMFGLAPSTSLASVNAVEPVTDQRPVPRT